VTKAAFIDDDNRIRDGNCPDGGAMKAAEAPEMQGWLKRNDTQKKASAESAFGEKPDRARHDNGVNLAR
jgi:hypothetical protein